MRARYRPRPEVIETNLPHELILLDPRSQEMFSLNATGRLVWRSLAVRDELDVAAELASRYSLPEERTLADVRRVLQDLLTRDLIEVLVEEDAVSSSESPSRA